MFSLYIVCFTLHLCVTLRELSELSLLQTKYFMTIWRSWSDRVDLSGEKFLLKINIFYFLCGHTNSVWKKQCLYPCKIFEVELFVVESSSFADVKFSSRKVETIISCLLSGDLLLQ